MNRYESLDYYQLKLANIYGPWFVFFFLQGKLVRSIDQL